MCRPPHPLINMPGSRAAFNPQEAEPACHGAVGGLRCPVHRGPIAIHVLLPGRRMPMAGAFMALILLTIILTFLVGVVGYLIFGPRES